jgi:hypothetical protein
MPPLYRERERLNAGRFRRSAGDAQTAFAARGVPEWEGYAHTPAVFVRVADKGLTAYVKWKSAQVIENKGQRTENGKEKMENGKRRVHAWAFCMNLKRKELQNLQFVSD